MHDATARRYAYAFQPIVDAEARRVHAHEALIRGPNGEPAHTVLAGLAGEAMHALDRASRCAAIEEGGRLAVCCDLTLNALPGSLDDRGAHLAALLDSAERAGVAPGRLVLEVTEGEAIDDHERFAAIVDDYRGAGLRIAIDDFGAGYSGLNLLADFQPDLIKLDMNLVRGIASRGARQSIARAIVRVCDDLGIEVIAEGVETVDEWRWFAGEGVRLFQGYLFARPGFRCLPEAVFPEAALTAGR